MRARKVAAARQGFGGFEEAHVVVIRTRHKQPGLILIEVARKSAILVLDIGKIISVQQRVASLAAESIGSYTVFIVRVSRGMNYRHRLQHPLSSEFGNERVKEGMIGLDQCGKCAHQGCSKQPPFGVAGTKKLIFFSGCRARDDQPPLFTARRMVVVTPRHSTNQEEA